MIIPAYIPLTWNNKYCASPTCCKPEVIPTGTLVFYSAKEKHSVWHFECGLDEWKTSGTPYDTRVQLAKSYANKKQLAQKNTITHKTPNGQSHEIDIYWFDDAIRNGKKRDHGQVEISAPIAGSCCKCEESYYADWEVLINIDYSIQCVKCKE